MRPEARRSVPRRRPGLGCGSGLGLGHAGAHAGGGELPTSPHRRERHTTHRPHRYSDVVGAAPPVDARAIAWQHARHHQPLAVCLLHRNSSSFEALRRPVESAQYLSIRRSARWMGDSYDNALAESVIGLFKTEVIRRRRPWRSLEDVEFATLGGIDGGQMCPYPSTGHCAEEPYTASIGGCCDAGGF